MKKTIKKNEPMLPRATLMAILRDRQTISNVIQQPPYTCVILTSWYNGREYTGVGFSKLRPPETWSAELGSEIANGRALIDVLHQIRWDELTDIICAKIEEQAELSETLDIKSPEYSIF